MRSRKEKELQPHVSGTVSYVMVTCSSVCVLVYIRLIDDKSPTQQQLDVVGSAKPGRVPAVVSRAAATYKTHVRSVLSDGASHVPWFWLSRPADAQDKDTNITTIHQLP
jgi:hypothetical protein